MLVCNEVASGLLAGGVNFRELSHTARIDFQRSLLEIILAVHRAMEVVMKDTIEDVLMISDRGTFDASVCKFNELRPRK